MPKSMKGLAILIGKPKGSRDDGEGDSEASDAGEEDDLFLEAFHALKEDDEEGFVKALKAGVKACVMKEKEGGYEGEE